MNVSIIGAGSWGSALSLVLSQNNHKVQLWTKKTQNEKKFKYFPNVKIPKGVSFIKNLNEMSNSKIILIALPSHTILPVLSNLKIKEKAIIVNCSKGLDAIKEQRLSTSIEKDLKINKKNIVVLSGPSHAEEVVKKIPTAVVASSVSKKNAAMVQNLFSNDYFRVYTNSDIIGTEIGGVCKNIISIASGISSGLGYGDNTIAALISRGLKEIVRLGMHLGAKKSTFYGLSGLGDLSVTAFSSFSRNREFGIKIGEGLKTDQAQKEIGMVVEGIKATKIVHSISRKEKINMPIVNKVYSILFNNKNPKLAINELMNRKLTSEII